MWTQTHGTYASLQVIFGMPASNISKWLWFSKRILLLALMGVEEAKIKMPSLQQVQLFQEVIKAKYPTLTHVGGAMDGLKVNIHKPTNDILQSHFYIGWTHAIDEAFYSMEGTAKVVVDSAFAAEDCPSLVKLFTNSARHNGQLRQPHRLNNDATAVTQMAEQGIQGFQSSFP